MFFATSDPGIEYAPYFYAEARIDFGDVRTGFRDTISLNKAMDICPNDANLCWADDMIREVDISKVTSTIPNGARLRPQPGFVDEPFISRMENHLIRYLLRTYKIRIYRNFALNIYSLAGESLEAFVSRCTELLKEPMRHELHLLQEVFNRKLEQIKQRYLGLEIPRDLEQAKMDSQNRETFSRASEKIDDLFMRSDLGPSTAFPALYSAPEMTEMEERLFSLEVKAQRSIEKVIQSYFQKARTIDEYILHPNLKDIHFVRSGILWMPAKAE